VARGLREVSNTSGLKGKEEVAVRRGMGLLKTGRRSSKLMQTRSEGFLYLPLGGGPRRFRALRRGLAEGTKSNHVQRSNKRTSSLQRSQAATNLRDKRDNAARL